MEVDNTMAGGLFQSVLGARAERAARPTVILAHVPVAEMAAATETGGLEEE